LSDNTPREFVYFKDRAKELGCTNVSELGDLEVWQYIIKHQPGGVNEKEV